MQDNEMVSILKDIDDRKTIIQNYQLTGCLNREKAISKIKELRLLDADVQKVTMAKLTDSPVPFPLASDQAIVAELQMQVDILSSKLV